MRLGFRTLLRRFGVAGNARSSEASPREQVSLINEVFDVRNVSIAAWNGYPAAASFTWDDTQASHGAIAESTSSVPLSSFIRGLNVGRN